MTTLVIRNMQGYIQYFRLIFEYLSRETIYLYIAVNLGDPVVMLGHSKGKMVIQLNRFPHNW